MTITLVRGDITERAVDAIVSAANSWLMPGGGVDGGIHRAGGPTILEACKGLIEQQHPSGLTVGQAVATPAGRLRAQWVIHTVCPIYSTAVDRSDQLIGAYRAALRVADELKAKSAAFPALSTGAYAYPNDKAAQVALEAVRYAKTALELVEFVLLDEVVFEAFSRAVFGNRPPVPKACDLQSTIDHTMHHFNFSLGENAIRGSPRQPSLLQALMAHPESHR